MVNQRVLFDIGVYRVVICIVFQNKNKIIVMSTMSFYRVVISKNEIISCFPTTQTTYVNEVNVMYESDINLLTFALIKAENDREAITIAQRMLRERQSA